MTIKKILTNGLNEPGRKVSFSALVKSTAEKTTKNGKPYLECVLMDKTGEIIFRKWDSDSYDLGLLKPNCVLSFTNTDVSEFNGIISVSARDICYTPVANPNRSDYVFTVLKNPDEAAKTILKLVNSIKNDRIRIICQNLIENEPFKSRFFTYPAGNKKHHAEMYGLLCHTSRMMEAADGLCSVFPCDRDIVLASLLFHDAGKIYEMVPNAAGVGEYTKYALLGHIYIGAEMISSYYDMNLITEEEYLKLTHCVLAHHGKKDWGSPVEPMIPEALVVHAVDYLDAQMNAMENSLAHMSDGEFNNWVYKAPKEETENS